MIERTRTAQPTSPHVGTMPLLSIGTRIVLIEMPDDPDPIRPYSTGSVTGFGPGQVHVQWDNGRFLSLIPGVDKYERLYLSRDELICNRYMNGETMQQIGEAFGISRERVRQLLSRNGVKSRPRGRPRKGE